MAGPPRGHCPTGRTKGRRYLPVATEFNLWTAAGKQTRHSGNWRQRQILFHNHPTECVAYCVRLIRNLEGRGGQVGCGTSQLWKRRRVGTDPSDIAGIYPSLTILIFLVARSAIRLARDFVRQWETKDGELDVCPD